MARRHIAEGQARIARQRELIYRLAREGHPTDLAEALFNSLIDTLEQMRRHGDYLEACNLR